jgi:hypothetical protein
MAAVGALVRARLQARWRALVGLALLVGVASGSVMAAAIGARRTDTAYARLLEATRADDAEVEYGDFDGRPFRAFVGRLGRLPQVADLGIETTALLAPAMPGDPREYASGAPRFFSVASVDGRAGRTINRPLILAGRHPDPDRVDEIGVSENVAHRWRLRPGATFRVRAVAFKQLEAMFSGEQVVPAGPALALKVVAVQRLPDDPAIATKGSEGHVSLTPAFYRAYRGKVANLLSVRVHLKGGQADMGAFAAATRRLAGGVDSTVVPRAGLTRLVEDATRAQAVALALFAALAAAAALVVVGQALTRELSLASTGQETVRALGASRGHLLAATLVPIGLVGAAGAMVGAGVAVLASPLTPIGAGPAGRAGPRALGPPGRPRRRHGGHPGPGPRAGGRARLAAGRRAPAPAGRSRRRRHHLGPGRHRGPGRPAADLGHRAAHGARAGAGPAGGAGAGVPDRGHRRDHRPHRRA